VYLKDGVRRRLDSRDEVGRTEGQLLHLREMVDRILVEHDLAHLDQRELFVRPDLWEGRKNFNKIIDEVKDVGDRSL
jgi:hypothetical protein